MKYTEPLYLHSLTTLSGLCPLVTPVICLCSGAPPHPGMAAPTGPPSPRVCLSEVSRVASYGRPLTGKSKGTRIPAHRGPW